MPSAIESLRYDEGLICACELALERHWHRSKIRLTRKLKTAGRVATFYSMIDATRVQDCLLEQKENDGLPLSVVAVHPFVVPDMFFFGLRLRFDHAYETTYELTSASVSLFEGLHLEPIVRAEWDKRDIGRTNHAQPHWHLLGLSGRAPTASRRYDSGVPSSSEPVDFAPETSIRAEIGRIHFPSNAAWEAGNPARLQHQFFRESHLVDWLSGLGQYLEEQLRLVVSKSPNVARNLPREAADFTPG